MAEIQEVLDSTKELVDQSGLVIQRVKSVELLNQVLGLRYHVYCNERKFMDPQNYPQRIEFDKYDPYSIHFCTSDQERIIGTVRLVLNSSRGFPFEEYCRGKLYIDNSKSFRKEAAEISRLVISKRFRRMSADSRDCLREFIGSSHCPGLELFVLRLKPIALGMYRAMYIESKGRGIKYWYALMERSLHTLLRTYGFEFAQIGDEIDMCGTVAPYMVSIKKIEKTLRERFPLFIRK